MRSGTIGLKAGVHAVVYFEGSGGQVLTVSYSGPTIDWNGHPIKTNSSSAVTLTAGQKYDIRMEYFDNTGGAVAHLYWAYPGQSQQAIPQIRLYPATVPSAREGVTRAEVATPDLGVAIYPIPAHDEVRIRYYAALNGELTMQLINSAGQEVLRTIHPVTLGENLITLPVLELTRGWYILSLMRQGQRIARKIILSE